MENNQVILVRKQSHPYIVTYPYGSDGRPREYVWAGTKGNALSKRPVPYEVFEWLKESTSCFQSGCLLIEEQDNDEVKYAKEAIENIEEIEKCVLTRQEVIDILEKGNHLSLKKALNDITKDKNETFKSSTIRYICGIATEMGIDSSAKRKVLSEWAGIDFEKSDLIFDKNIENLYDK